MLTCPNCGRESPEEFAFCPACARPLAPPAPGREVRKTVSVLFCDVTGSTALGERLDPESLRNVQSRYFDSMRAAIERHGGTVEKYIGDAVMAVFGIPQVHEDDALRAARAAMDMLEALRLLNKELERDRGVAIEVRIGVNTGSVVAGDPASGQALVTGDAVNVAARLEQRAASGQVLIGETTHRLLRGVIEAEPLEALELKGKADAVPAFRLVSVLQVPGAIPRRLDSPLVGRERPLEQLRRAFEAAVEDSATHLFTLLGAAGVGKSRLVEEFVGGVGERATVLRGRCLPYGEGITYFPVVEAIKEAAGLADFDLPDVIEAKVCSVLEGDEHQGLVCRHMSQLLGVGETTAGDETFWAIRRFFEAVATGRPLVLAFDDVHWGEPTFLDLVEHVADWSRGSPILLLCMARPELLDVRATWGGGKLNATTVSLEPLTEDEAAAFIANLLDAAELPPDATARIVSTAEGNPLFVEETLGMLIDGGLVVREDDRWVAAGDLAEVAVPPSIQALLAARLDRLGPQERTVLEAASVVGKAFFAGAVRDLVDEPLAEVSGALMALVRKELVRPERSTLPGEDAFGFRHLLIRDAAYEAIPKAQRADLHERMAGWLERVAGDAVAEQEEIVGYHLEQAHAYRLELGPPDERSDALAARAAARLGSAGRRASGRGDSVAAANLLRRALAVGPPDAERARILVDLGEALWWIGDLAQMTTSLDEAIRLADASEQPALGWMARIRRSAAGTLADPLGTPTEEIRAELEEAVRVFEELGDEAGLAVAWTQLAETEWMPCRYASAERAGGTALEHARRSGDDRLVAGATVLVLAAQAFGLRTPEEGLRTVEEMRAEPVGSRWVDLVLTLVRGQYLAMQGDVETGTGLLLGVERAATELGLMLGAAGTAQQLGSIYLQAGDAAAAVDAFRRNVDVLGALGDEGHRSTGAGLLARALCALDRHTEAEPFARIARETAAPDDVASQSAGRSAEALVGSARGRYEEAERLAREAVQLYVDAGAQAPEFEVDARLDLATVLRAAGKEAEARAEAREALAVAERKGSVLASNLVRRFLGSS